MLTSSPRFTALGSRLLFLLPPTKRQFTSHTQASPHTLHACFQAGGSSISDAFCSSETGADFRTTAHVGEVKALNNDLVVRSAYADVQGETIKLRVKDLRRTAMASPFAAALGSDPNTVICLILDLSNPNGIKDIDAKVSTTALHGLSKVPMLLVGAKADLPRAFSFEEASAAARSHGLPYVECVALDKKDSCEALEALPDVGPMYRLALAMAAGLDDLTAMPQGEADRAAQSSRRAPTSVQRFISKEFLSDIKAKAEREGVIEGVGKNDKCDWCPQVSADSTPFWDPDNPPAPDDEFSHDHL